MKKTIAVLFALSCLAAAETADLGGVTGTWSTYNGSWTLTSSSASVTGWGGSTSMIVLDEAISLNQGQTLTFSYTIANSTPSNSLYSITLRNGSGNPAIMFGKTDYATAEVAIATAVLASSGYHESISTKDPGVTKKGAQTLAVNSGSSTDRIQAVTPDAGDIITLTNAGAYEVHSTIAYDESISQFVLTMAADSKTVQLNLGQSVDFNTIVLYAEGGKHTMSNLSLTVTPEPATATLSLLALAGLAARRRRH